MVKRGYNGYTDAAIRSVTSAPAGNSEEERLRVFLASVSADTSVSHMRDFLGVTGLSTSMLETLVNTMKRDPSSPVYTRATQKLVSSLNKREEEVSSRLTVHVRPFLTAEQKHVVSASRPHLNIKFGDTQHMSHSMANMQRKLDEAEQVRLIPDTDSVLEIGGNPVSAILRGRENWIVTTPIIDLRDGQRGNAFAKFVDSVKRGSKVLRPESQRVWNKYIQNPGSFVRKECAEKIKDVQVDWIYAQHSLYDVGLENLACIMFNTKARGCYGSIVMNESTLYEESGELPALGGYFERCGKNMEYIQFGFHGDPSFLYRHKFSEYAKYFYSTTLYYRGELYAYTVYNRYADTVQYRCMRMSNTRIYEPLPSLVYKFTGKAKWLRITGPYVDGDRAPTASDRVKQLEYFVPASTALLVMERLKVEKGAWDRSVLLSYMRSQDVRFVINNVVVKAQNRIPNAVFHHLAAVLQVMAEHEVHEERKAIADVTSAMKIRRDGGRDLLYINKLINGFGSWVSGLRQQLTNPTREFLLSRFKAWEYIPTISECTDIEKVMIARVAPMISQRVYEEFQPTVETVDLPVDLDVQRGLLEVALTDDSLSEEEVMEIKSMLESLPKSDDAGDKVVDVVTGNDDTDASSSSCGSSCDATESSIGTSVDEDVVYCHDPLDGVVINEEVVQSISEFGRIQKASHDAVIGEAVYFRGQTSIGKKPSLNGCKTATSVVKPTDNTAKLSVDDLQHNYLRVVNNVVVESFRPQVGNPTDYQWFLKDNNKCKIDNHDGECATTAPDGWYYVNQHFTVLINKELEAAANKVLLDPTLINVRPMKAINGVPGCGKTTYICNIVKQFMDTNCKDFFVAVAAKKSQLDTLNRLLRDLGEHDPWRKILKQRIRTVDSFVLKPLELKPEVFFIDEGRMLHSGQVMAAVHLLNPQRVEILGDPQQVPYVNFSNVFMMHGSSLKFEQTVEHNITYRLPIRVAAMVAHMYDGKIRVGGKKNNGSPFEGDTSVIKINAYNEVPKLSNVLYICFYQWEKKQLIQSGYCKNHSTNADHRCSVLSVVEAQGSDFADVIVVRLEPRSRRGTIYSEPQRVNSALTRAWRSVKYYTTCDNDMLATWMRVGATNESISRVMGEYDITLGEEVLYNELCEYKKPDFRKLASKAKFTTIDY